MKPGVQIAGAIAVGYLLGRKRRMALALMLGIAAATGQLSRARDELMQRTAGSLTEATTERLVLTGVKR